MVIKDIQRKSIMKSADRMATLNIDTEIKIPNKAYRHIHINLGIPSVIIIQSSTIHKLVLYVILDLVGHNLLMYKFISLFGN